MKQKIAYWTTTGLLGIALLGAGVMDLTANPDLLVSMEHLGYPPSLLTILGAWALAGALALLAPGVPRIKEWAYAGVVFQMTGASASHLFAGDSFGQAAPSLVLGALAVASYVLRPASRRPDSTVEAHSTSETRGRPAAGTLEPA